MVMPTGTPSTMYTATGQQHVFFRGSDGALYQVFYDPGTNSVGRPEQWGSEIVGNPATMYSARHVHYESGDLLHHSSYDGYVYQQHVFFRDGDGYIWQTYYDEETGIRHGPEQWIGPGHRATDVPAAYDPATLFTPEGQQHVFYVGTDSGLYHVFYNPGTGNLSDTERWV